jgi:hypothetical protein
MKKVIATNMSARLGVNIRELGRIAKEGEEFECTDDRLIVLSGNNKFHAVFAVEKPVAEDVKPVTEAVTEEVTEETTEEPVVEKTKVTKKKTKE